MSMIQSFTGQKCSSGYALVIKSSSWRLKLLLSILVAGLLCTLLNFKYQTENIK